MRKLILVAVFLLSLGALALNPPVLDGDPPPKDCGPSTCCIPNVSCRA